MSAPPPSYGMWVTPHGEQATAHPHGNHPSSQGYPPPHPNTTYPAMGQPPSGGYGPPPPGSNPAPYYSPGMPLQPGVFSPGW